MENILEILGSEQGIQVLFYVLGGVWAAVKGSEWWQRRVDRRVDQAADTVIAGVRDTYENYVLAAKRGNDDGRLTLEQRNIARNTALARARKLSLEQGIDLAKTLGPEQAEVWVERAIGILKNRSLG